MKKGCILCLCLLLLLGCMAGCKKKPEEENSTGQSDVSGVELDTDGNNTTASQTTDTDSGESVHNSDSLTTTATTGKGSTTTTTKKGGWGWVTFWKKTTTTVTTTANTTTTTTANTTTTGQPADNEADLDWDTTPSSAGSTTTTTKKGSTTTAGTTTKNGTTTGSTTSNATTTTTTTAAKPTTTTTAPVEEQDGVLLPVAGTKPLPVGTAGRDFLVLGKVSRSGQVVSIEVCNTSTRFETEPEKTFLTYVCKDKNGKVLKEGKANFARLKPGESTIVEITMPTGTAELAITGAEAEFWSEFI